MLSPRTLKEAMRPGVRGFFRLLPFPLALRLAGADRRLFNQLPSGHTLRFDGYHGDLSVRVDTTYPIERQMLSGEYDPDTARVIRAFVRQGDICVDVGANVGAHTLLLAKLVAPKGKVYAFEPGPPVFDRLRANLELNPLLSPLVCAERVGLSDAEGQLFWNEDLGNRGNAHLRDGSGIAVPITTLDRYFVHGGRLARIAFIKIDVETMEYHVLKGATELLRRDRPILYFETMPGALEIVLQREGVSLFKQLEDLLISLGYSLFKVAGRRGRLVRVSADQFADNTLGLPAGHSHYTALPHQHTEIKSASA